MKRTYFVFLAVLALNLVSCAASAKSQYKDPYPTLDILDYENNTAYEFKNENSNKLVIYIEGTSWNSVLGWKEGDQWQSVTVAYYFVDLMKDNYNILIPERLNMQIGNYYGYNPAMRRNYTLGNLVDSYSSTINTYLDTHEYDSIVLAGYSEGACLLPLIYKNVKSQSNIKGIVSMSYGGLSVYEQIKILGESPLEMTDYYREACLSVDEYKKDVELYPDSIGEIMGYTYGWWNSFKDYRPIDDYREINIPVLFVHGKLDIMVPVESTEYIQENLPDKPFEYLYIDDLDHYFSREDGKAIIKDKIVEWINKR